MSPSKMFSIFRGGGVPRHDLKFPKSNCWSGAKVLIRRRSGGGGTSPNFCSRRKGVGPSAAIFLARLHNLRQHHLRYQQLKWKILTQKTDCFAVTFITTSEACFRSCSSCTTSRCRPTSPRRTPTERSTASSSSPSQRWEKRADPRHPHSVLTA